MYDLIFSQKPVIEQIRAEVKSLNLAKEQQNYPNDSKNKNESVDDVEMSIVDNDGTSNNDKTSQRSNNGDISIIKSPNSPGINLTNWDTP